MAETQALTLNIFNRGRVGRDALARTDVPRVVNSAEVQTNMLPRALGPMDLRPGFEFIQSFGGNGGTMIPFVFAADDTAIIRLGTNNLMQVLNDGTDLVTRPAVTADVANPGFTSDLGGWTDADEGTAASTWATGGYLQLLGTGTSAAILRQTVTINEIGTLHALRVEVERGPVEFRVGTSAGLDGTFPTAVLRTGVHSLAFIPDAASVVIEFASRLTYPVLVDRCQFEAAGPMAVPIPWTSQEERLRLRYQQINDVTFVASDRRTPYRIERRGNDSWSVVKYEPDDGPYLPPNVDDGLRITPTGLNGAITLNANQRIFRGSNVGGLYRLTSAGQQVEADLSAADTYTAAIRVAGVGEGRGFQIIREGTVDGTLTLQRSIGVPDEWVDTDESWTTTGTATYRDDLDNVVAYYRVGFKPGEYTSGTAEVTLEYAGGSLTGIVRITAVATQLQATAVVLKPLGGTAATSNWIEGAWSDRRGWPTAVALNEGRLRWAGRGRDWGTLPDDFQSFDPDVEGDAGAIDKAVGGGPIDTVNWLIPLRRLVAGTARAEVAIGSSSLDEVTTPANYNSRETSNWGSSHDSVPAVIDGRAYFVDVSGTRVIEVAYALDRNDYAARNLVELCPELGDAGFNRIAVQRRPDTRVHVSRADGTVALLLRDPVEDVLTWIDVETDGAVGQIIVLPGAPEDRVFYQVTRNGEVFLVRWALDSECRRGTQNCQADFFVRHNGEAVATIEGLEHLNGEVVVIWGDGRYLGTANVLNGSVTLPQPCAVACVGLGYTGLYKSAKLQPLASRSTPDTLMQVRRIAKIGFVLNDAWHQGIEFGPDFETMDKLPMVEAAAPAAEVYAHYHGRMTEFPGDPEMDPRLCLRMRAPLGATVMAAVLGVTVESDV